MPAAWVAPASTKPAAPPATPETVWPLVSAGCCAKEIAEWFGICSPVLFGRFGWRSVGTWWKGMNFDEIKKLWRRCNHFIGPAYDLLPSEDKPCMEVYGPIFHNGSEVKSVYVNKAGELQDGPAQNHVEWGKWLSRNEWMYRPYIGTSRGWDCGGELFGYGL